MTVFYMKNKNIFFWQPHSDILALLNQSFFGKTIVVILNYLIWIFLFYISFLLIRFQTNIFWQLLFATILGEIIERYGKSHALWRRPLFQRNDSTPIGLVDSWYKTGSFPSGHTIKAIFFLLFLIQYPVFPVSSYLLLVTPLLIFRVLVGFHYPLDMIGGIIFGIFCWLLSHQVSVSSQLTTTVRVIFNFIFHL